MGNMSALYNRRLAPWDVGVAVVSQAKTPGTLASIPGPPRPSTFKTSHLKVMNYKSVTTLAVVVLGALSASLAGQESLTSFPRVPPTEAREADKKFHVQAGFRLELLASEPLT